WAARERELLPFAGRVSGARSGLPGIRRPAQWPKRGDPQRCAVAAALRRRQRDRRTPGQARRQQLYGHRRDAERVRERPVAFGRYLVATAVRPVITPAEPGVGTSPAHGGTVAGGRRRGSGRA